MGSADVGGPCPDLVDGAEDGGSGVARRSVELGPLGKRGGGGVVEDGEDAVVGHFGGGDTAATGGHASPRREHAARRRDGSQARASWG